MPDLAPAGAASAGRATDAGAASGRSAQRHFAIEAEGLENTFRIPKHQVQPLVVAEGTTVGAAAIVAAGTAIGPGAMVGEEAFVGAGAVVTRDVAARSLMVGAPARHVREVDPREEIGPT